MFGFHFSISLWNYRAVIFCVRCEGWVSAEYNAMRFLAGKARDLFVTALQKGGKVLWVMLAWSGAFHLPMHVLISARELLQ